MSFPRIQNLTHWYEGYIRHQTYFRQPSVFLRCIHCKCAQWKWGSELLLQGVRLNWATPFANQTPPWLSQTHLLSIELSLTDSPRHPHQFPSDHFLSPVTFRDGAVLSRVLPGANLKHLHCIWEYDLLLTLKTQVPKGKLYSGKPIFPHVSSLWLRAGTRCRTKHHTGRAIAGGTAGHDLLSRPSESNVRYENKF